MFKLLGCLLVFIATPSWGWDEKEERENLLKKLEILLELNVPESQRNPFAILGIKRSPIDTLVDRADKAYLRRASQWAPHDFGAENFHRVLEYQAVFRWAYRVILGEAKRVESTIDSGEGWPNNDSDFIPELYDPRYVISGQWIRWIEGELGWGLPKDDIRRHQHLFKRIPGIEFKNNEQLEAIYIGLVEKRFASYQATKQANELELRISAEADDLIKEARNLHNYWARNILGGQREHSSYRRRIDAKVFSEVIMTLWARYQNPRMRPEGLPPDQYWLSVNFAFGGILESSAFYSARPYLKGRELLRMTEVALILQHKLAEFENSTGRPKDRFVGEIQDILSAKIDGSHNPVQVGIYLGAYLTLHPEFDVTKIKSQITTVLDSFLDPNSFRQKIAHRIQPFPKTRILEAMTTYLINVPALGAETGLSDLRINFLVKQVMEVGEKVLSPTDFAVFLDYVHATLSVTPQTEERAELVQMVSTELNARKSTLPPVSGCRSALYRKFASDPQAMH